MMSLQTSPNPQNSQKFTKLAVATTLGVLLLHAMTGWSLLNMQSPLLKPIETKKEQLIEITLLDLEESPTPPEPEIKKAVVPTPPKPKANKVVSQPVKKTKPTPKIEKTKPVKPKSKPTPAPKAKPIVKKEPVKQVPKPKPKTQPKPKKQPKPQAKTQPKKVIATDKSAQKKKQWEAQQARIAAKAAADAKAKADAAKAKAAADAKAKADAAKAKAAADAKAKADAAKTKAAANKTYNFSSSQASWRRKPRANFPKKAQRGLKSGTTLTVGLKLSVDKQGNVTSVNISKSSGNSIIDSAAKKAAASGKLHPFKKNGVPVKGSVSINLRYVKP